MKFLEQNDERIHKTFESFLGGIFGGKSKYDDYENVSKAGANGGEVDAATKNKILNVENFNEWLSKEYMPHPMYGKGQPGLIGRGDKLSESMVEDYFLNQGVQCSDQEIWDFMDKIRKYWMGNR